jgi:hypothetical protein
LEGELGAHVIRGEISMLDIVMLGLGLSLFALSIVYAFLCDRL